MIEFRDLLARDQAALWHWLHIALWDPPPSGLRPRQVLDDPGVRIYAEDWGRASDIGVVAGGARQGILDRTSGEPGHLALRALRVQEARDPARLLPDGRRRRLTAIDEEHTMHKGSCLCGAVTFEVEGDLKTPEACHCSQCRKQSGHYWAATDVPKASVTIHGDDTLTWYRASDKARRGFCSTCGSFLFWDAFGTEEFGIGMGAFDGPTGVKLGLHIFVADRGDYYDIADGLPQNPQ